MSRFSRIRRRPDHWASPHERARARAAERLDGPLGLSEATWLDEHLAGCSACAAIAASYETDRLALRTLRDAAPEPPRDLWARTAAAIEHESQASGRSRRATATSGRRIPVGVLSGMAVIVVVVAVSAVSGGLLDGSGPSTALTGPASASPAGSAAPSDAATDATIAGAAPTPFGVGAGDVEWFGTDADGQVAYKAAAVSEVCPVDNATSCATIDDSATEHLAMSASPKSIIGSPTEGQAVVVTDDGAGGQRITVLSLPAADPTPIPTMPPTAAPTIPPASAAPTPSEPTESAAPTSTATVAPSGSPETTTQPTTEPSGVPPSVAPTTEPSAEPTATAEPTVEPSPSPTVEPSLSPEPTIAVNLAIASDITVVGESAAFSDDGRWFAFTARPSDGSAGPDVYLWRVGEKTAKRLTTDGATYFASWDGDTVVASRPDTGSTDPDSPAITTLIDPRNGRERAAGDLWRPVVAPTADRAVAWTGTVAASADGLSVGPTDGRLELRSWSSSEGASSSTGRSQVIATGPVTDFDVRWDESGGWFATWVADPSGSDVGRLSLYHVDPASGKLEQPEGAPADVAALPGFSIGEGRLAWATPPGQGGEGSRVQIVAWTDDGVGTVETAPGEDLVVVR